MVGEGAPGFGLRVSMLVRSRSSLIDLALIGLRRSTNAWRASASRIKLQRKMSGVPCESRLVWHCSEIEATSARELCESG